MERASWRSKLTAIVLGIIIPVIWVITRLVTDHYIYLHFSQMANIAFCQYLSGLVLLLIIMPLYNKLPIKIKIGMVFSKKSFLPIASVFLIYLAGHVCTLLLSGHQNEWVKSVVYTPWSYVIPMFLTILVLGPIEEELIFRGYMANAFPLEKKWGMIACAIVISTIYSLMHRQYENFVISLQLATLGLIYIWARIRSGGVGLPIFLHFLANALATVSGLLLP